MIQQGTSPYLDCSSRGIRRLNAANAHIKARDHRTIEDICRAAKIFPKGFRGVLWRLTKGRRPVNGDEVQALHSRLWDEYIAENPDLLDLICVVTGLCDASGKAQEADHISELWRIREASLAARYVEAEPLRSVA